LVASKGTAPVGRSSPTVAAVGRKVYVHGGEDVPRNVFDPVLHCFDLDTNEWTAVETKGDAPALVLAHASAVVGNTIFFIGGRAANKEDVNDVHAFHTLTNTWQKITTSGDPFPDCSYHAATTVGNDIIVFGGCHGHGRLNEVWKLETSTGKWEHLPVKGGEAPTQRGGPGLVGHGGSIFVYAGYQGKEELDDLHEYNWSSNTWTKPTLSSIPPARSVHSANLLGNGIAIYGGEAAPSATGHEGAGAYLADTWFYDFDTKAWSKLDAGDETPSPRGWQASASVFNSSGVAEAVVLYGGYGGEERLGGNLYILRA